MTVLAVWALLLLGGALGWWMRLGFERMNADSSPKR